MNRNIFFTCIVLIFIGFFQIYLSTEADTRRAADSPAVMLWAWERNEDLTFLKNENVGVAYLAQTLILSKTEVILRPRFQPLKVNPETHLVAVTRIESYRPKSEFSEFQLEETAKLIAKTSLDERIRGIQIDFDVKVSEREFYRKLLHRVREQIPKDKPLTITALASFCMGDRWMKDLPIDEAVPMLFEMGADTRNIRLRLKNEKDFSEPLCRTSYGLATYEPLDAKLKPNRTIYYFNSRAWKTQDLENLK